MSLVTLNSKIQTTLDSVNELAIIYDRPLERTEQISGFPAAVYYYQSFTNDFETNQENLKEYIYTIVLIQEVRQKGMEAAHGTVMAGLIDAVVDQFDADWDQGASAEGHRIWWRLTGGDINVFEEHAGLLISAELSLSIKLITND